MAFDKTNRGTLRENTNRQEEWHPDFRGDVNVEGVDFWIDATSKQWPDGTHYYSLKVRRKEPRADAPAHAPARALAPAPARAPAQGAHAPSRARTIAPARNATAPASAPIDDEIPF